MRFRDTMGKSAFAVQEHVNEIAFFCQIPVAPICSRLMISDCNSNGTLAAIVQSPDETMRC